MNKQLKLFTIFTALLTLTILGAGIGYAAPSQDRVVINGEIVRDDLNITDNLIIEAGGLVTEDVNILGGHAYISGTISGDLVVLGGNVELAESAGIGGDCVIIGGNIQRNDSPVRCTSIAEGANLPLAAIPSITKDRANLWGGSWATVGNAILTSFLLAIFAFGITAIAPKHIERISDAITLKPVASGTVGILTFLAAISAITLLSLLSALLTIVCIGLLGFPIVLAMGVLLIGALLVGWVAIGKIAGDILRDTLKLRRLSMPMTAGIGTAVFSLANTLISTQSAIGIAANIVILFIGAIGLGATALTRFGTRPWPRLVIKTATLEDEIIIKPLSDDINFL